MNISENSLNRKFIKKNNTLSNSKNNKTKTLRYKAFQTIPFSYSTKFMNIPAMNVLNKDYSISKNTKILQSSNRFNSKNKKYFLNTLALGKISSLIKNNYNNKLLVKKGGIIFCLRKIFIILPENMKLINENLSMRIYFPIKDPDIKINKISMNEKGIFCYNIDNIFDEVKKKLGICCNSNEIKMNIYNEDFNLIINDNQLMEKSAKNKLIYVKIGKIFSEQNIKNSNICMQYNKKQDESKINFQLNQRNNRHFIFSNLNDYPFYNNNSIYSSINAIRTKRYSLSNFYKTHNNFFTMASIEKWSPSYYNDRKKSLNPLAHPSNLIPETKKSTENSNTNKVNVEEEKDKIYFPRIKSKGLWKSSSNFQIKNIQRTNNKFIPNLNFQNKFINSKININNDKKEMLCESIFSIDCDNKNNSKEKITQDISDEAQH